MSPDARRTYATTEASLLDLGVFKAPEAIQSYSKNNALLTASALARCMPLTLHRCGNLGIPDNSSEVTQMLNVRTMICIRLAGPRGSLGPVGAQGTRKSVSLSLSLLLPPTPVPLGWRLIGSRIIDASQCISSVRSKWGR